MDKNSQGRNGGQLAFARVLKMSLPGPGKPKSLVKHDNHPCGTLIFIFHLDKHCLPLLLSRLSRSRHPPVNHPNHPYLSPLYLYPYFRYFSRSSLCFKAPPPPDLQLSATLQKSRTVLCLPLQTSSLPSKDSSITFPQRSSLSFSILPPF